MKRVRRNNTIQAVGRTLLRVLLAIVLCAFSYPNFAGFISPVASFSPALDPVATSMLSGEITGPSPVCIPSDGIVYSIDPVVGATDYNWSVPTGATITNGQGTPSITVDFSGSATSDSVEVDVAGSTPVHYSIFVTLNNRPVPTITGPVSVCRGNTNQLTIVTYTTEAGKSNYVWTISQKYTIRSGGGTNDNFVTLVWRSAGAKTISVSYTDEYGCTPISPSSLSVTVIGPTVSGPTEACKSTNPSPIYTYTYTTESGKSAYTWSGGLGVSIVSGQNTSTAVIKFMNQSTGNPLTPRYVVCQYTDGGCTTKDSLPVLVYPTQATISNIGANNPCVNTSVQYYTESNQSNYIWTVPSGGTVISGGTTSDYTITILWTATGSKTVGVTYTSSASCPLSPGSKNLTVNPLPVPTITGPSGCQTSGLVYTTETGMLGYSWNISSGGTITNGGNSSTLKTESFENSGLAPTGWTTEQVTTANAITFPTSTTFPAGYNAYDGTYLVSFGSHSATANTASRIKMTTPISTIGYSPVVDFAWLESASYSTVNDRVAVQYSTNGTSWTTAANATFSRYNATPGWKIKSVTLPIATCNVSNLYIAFLFTSGGNGDDCYLDFMHITASSSSATVTWNDTGAQTLSVSYTNSNSCTAASPTVSNITVNPLPIPTITGPASACEDAPGQVYSTEAGMTGYTWSITGGTINSGGGSNSVSVTWTSVGTRSISVSYTSNGCAAAVPTEKSVTVLPRPGPGPINHN